MSLISTFSTALPDDATLTSEFLGWSGRIVGGQTAAPGQFPYQASCRTTANGHFCGNIFREVVKSDGFNCINRFLRWFHHQQPMGYANIIFKILLQDYQLFYLVGSAAHCTINRTPANMIVVVGAHHRITGGVSMAVARVVNHPEYHAPTTTQDVSVVQTVNPIIFGVLVAAIPLGANVNLANVPSTGSGWGQTSHPGSAATELQFVSSTIITNDDCRSRLSAGQAARIIASTICSLSVSGTGKCMGDSGGPLTSNGEIQGIVSWGVPCGNVQPDMYARVASFRDWFLQVIAS